MLFLLIKSDFITLHRTSSIGIKEGVYRMFVKTKGMFLTVLLLGVSMKTDQD